MFSANLFSYKNYGRLWRVYGRSFLTGTNPRRLLNALRTEYAYRRRLINVTSRPYLLFIEPLYYCNLSCPFCPREQHPEARKGREAGRLPIDLISQIFEELGDYLYQCHIFGNGEPMLDWATTSAIIAEARRRRIFTLVSSNCTIINPETAREVVTSGLHHMVCAIDGITQQAYEQYRVGGSCQDALAGMRMLVEAKRSTQSRMQIEWQYLVHAGNVHEIEKARALAHELGVYFRPAPMGGFPDPAIAQKWLPAEAQWRDAEPTKTVRRDFHCYWLWRGIVLNSNGQLGRCPGESNVHQLGSIRGRSIMSIYNGQTTQRARQLFSKHPVPDTDFPAPCRTCNYFCRTNGPPATAPPASAKHPGQPVNLKVITEVNSAPTSDTIA